MTSSSSFSSLLADTIKVHGKISPGQTIKRSWIRRSVLDATLFDRLTTHVGRCSPNIFCSIKCCLEFAFDRSPSNEVSGNGLLSGENVEALDHVTSKVHTERSKWRSAWAERSAIFC